MCRATIITGVVLVIMALGSYVGTGMASWTALIPIFFGLPLIVLGLVARNESRRKMALHGAAGIGLLGLLAPLGNLGRAISQNGLTLSAATITNIAMTIVCGVFFGLCIRSFLEARRRRAA